MNNKSGLMLRANIDLSVILPGTKFKTGVGFLKPRANQNRVRFLDPGIFRCFRQDFLGK
jgi:hypothetical protein